MNCEIIAVGTELLLGQIVNTNAAFLARELANLGIDVYNQSVVGDNRERLLNAINDAFSRSELVIFTGGLGPTQDDITRETVADYFGLELKEDEPTLLKFKAYFEKKKCSMPSINIRQAMVPSGSIVLENNHGMAPGSIIEKGGKTAVLLPGPPSELKPMFYESLRPYLSQKSGQQLYSKILRFFGIGESLLVQTIEDLINNQSDPTIASYLDNGDVILRLSSKGESRDEADKKINPIADEIKKRLSDYCYGEDDDTLPKAVYRLLNKNNMTLATAESCTGGMIGAALTSVPGISDYYGYGLITYANAAKEKLLGVKHETLENYGAVSEETAREMALGALKTSGADIAVSVTGIAGPGGGTEDKPVGLVYIGLADRTGSCAAYKNEFFGDREAVREKTVRTALNLVRKHLEKDSFARRTNGRSY